MIAVGHSTDARARSPAASGAGVKRVMIEEDLCVGAIVHHKAQPAWGAGVVVSIVRASAHVDVVVDFDDAGQKKLRLTADVFAWLTNEELAERTARLHPPKKKAPKAAKAQTLAPTLRVPGTFSTPVVVAGHTVVVSRDGGRVHAFDSAGADRVLGSVGNAWPAWWAVNGEAALGCDIHGLQDGVLVDLAAGTARAWRPPRDPGLARAFAADAHIVLWGQRAIFVVDRAGASVEVPLSLLPKQHLSDLCAFGDGFLGVLFREGAEANFEVVCLAKDGVVRFRHPGLCIAVIPDAAGDLALFVDRHVIVVVDGDGRERHRVPGFRPNSGHDHEPAFVVVDHDVVFCADEHVVHLHPASGRLLWNVHLPHAHGPPVVIGGRFAAVTAHLYGDHARHVVVIDLATGAVVVEGDGAAGVSHAVAVAGDAVVLRSYSKKLVGWRKLSTTIERVTLTDDDKVFDVVSPAAGVVVTGCAAGLAFWPV